MATNNKRWSWMVAIGSTASFTIIFPLTQAFGLLYRDTWIDLDFSGTQITFILCTALCILSSTSPFITNLIELFGCRILGSVGGCLMTLGFVFTAYTTKFEYFILNYGLIAAFGIGLAFQSFSLALNSYFPTTKKEVNDYIWTISGLGPILMPQLVAFLLNKYSVRVATLILAAIVAITMGMAILLRPKKEPKTIELVEKDEVAQFIDTKEDIPNENISSANKELEETKETKEDPVNDTDFTNEVVLKAKMSRINKSLKSMVNIFDTTLLKDPIFLNITFGLAFDFVSEMNFTVLLPFIMSDKNLDIDETATILSSMAITENIFKLLALFVADLLKLQERPMMVLTLIGLICARSSILFMVNLTPLIICAVFLGVFKGMRTVYWMRIIPNFVKIEKLPDALGLQFMINGILLLSGGYVFGLVKDFTGSFLSCVHAMNLMTLLFVISWTMEFIFKKCKRNVDATKSS